jgi:hypothetical protein
MDVRLVGGAFYMATGVHLEFKSHTAQEIIQIVHVLAHFEKRLTCCSDLMVYLCSNLPPPPFQP